MRKTMSLKQLAANRRNAQKSTGPKTPEGRAVSKMNALKHGILSKAGAGARLEHQGKQPGVVRPA